MSISKRYAEDEAFREVANILFGEGHEISKMNPAGPDLNAGDKKKKDFERKQAQIGLASNIVGLAAGAQGTKDAYSAYREQKKTKVGGKIGSFKPVTRKTKALAAGALGLQVANVGGDVVANRVLARSAKKDDKVKKSLRPIAKANDALMGDMPDTASVPNKGQRTRAAVTSAARAAGKGTEYSKGHFKKLPQSIGSKDKGKKQLKKSADLDVVWAGEISKVNTDKQQVFGWASIVEMNGEPVVDLQGDYITIDEVEKSAYDYVHKSRKGGDMHLRDGDQPVHASDMIESFVMTPEKKQILGMPEDTPTGWWVGYQVNDPEVWAKVKNGERTGFSVHGRGVRTPMDG